MKTSFSVTRKLYLMLTSYSFQISAWNISVPRKRLFLKMTLYNLPGMPLNPLPLVTNNSFIPGPPNATEVVFVMSGSMISWSMAPDLKQFFLIVHSFDSNSGQCHLLRINDYNTVAIVNCCVQSIIDVSCHAIRNCKPNCSSVYNCSRVR